MARTRTSATGATRLAAGPAGRPRRGFTLIELLLVLVIFGIAAGLATLRLLPDDARRARSEGDATALLIEHAAVEAESSGQPLAWLPAGGMSRFERPDGHGGWMAVADDAEFAARPLPSGLRWGPLQFRAGSLDRSAPTLSTAAFPGGTPGVAATALGATAVAALPRVVFLPGQLAPAFDIALLAGGAGVALHGDPLGTVTVGARP